MSPAAYGWFLAIGVVLTLADGLLVYRSCRKRLAGPASRGLIVTAIFALVALGALLVIPEIPYNREGLAGVLGRLFSLLLVLGTLHGLVYGALRKSSSG